MKSNSVLQSILKKAGAKVPSYWVLLDPDDFSPKEGAAIAKQAEAAGADALLIGGSLIRADRFAPFVASVKKAARIPVILFPGDATQLSGDADALLYLSLVSGRNPVNLISEHVKAAPLIKQLGIEPISTAYMLVESGTLTSVEFMSNTRPLPRSKPDIAAAHALAAQYMGMKLVYLEAGSGALNPVPNEMISLVRSVVDIPVIVGGGIRDAKTAMDKIRAGADIIVTGNLLQSKGGVGTMKEIAAAVRKAGKKR
ncbi:MAG TPA: geranylgeranylglyceryl/heptaprenylglyceryl phosphate synthase [Chitinivibrionales bacterium]|jgi:phosphoglycerol geranylgeranyltransferase|nr:geranylgeranylglyceryl/heptaprenylglyceryl phosphate synthase [Chitinivibrionales bacterium]